MISITIPSSSQPVKIILGKKNLLFGWLEKKKIVYTRSLTGFCRCDERFSDEPSACLYSIYLNGADLWVLSQDYTVRTGQEPENMLTQEEASAPITIKRCYISNMGSYIIAYSTSQGVQKLPYRAMCLLRTSIWSDRYLQHQSGQTCPRRMCKGVGQLAQGKDDRDIPLDMLKKVRYDRRQVSTVLLFFFVVYNIPLKLMFASTLFVRDSFEMEPLYL